MRIRGAELSASPRDCGRRGRPTALGTLVFAVLSAAAGAPARPAQAQAVRYEAPADCPDRNAFEARMRARSQRPKHNAHREFEVELSRGEGGVVGSIAVREADGSVTRRRIAAADCEEAVDALALIAALALDSAAAQDERRPKPATTPASTRGGRRAQRTRSDENARGQSADEAATDEAAADEPGTPPAAIEAPATRAITPRSNGQPPRSDPEATVGAELFASALALTAAAPNPQPAAEIGAAVSAPIARAAALRMRLSARITGTQRAEAPLDQGTAELRLWSAAGAVCPGTSPSDALWLFGCGVFEAGAVSASGSDTDDARDKQRVWLAAGAGVELTWLVVAPLRLHASVEGLVPLYRDRFLIGDRVVHRVPALAARAGLGVGVALW